MVDYSCAAIVISPVEDILDERVSDAVFETPSPGRLRIEKSPGVRRVFLDRPDMPGDRPVIEVRVEAGKFMVRRNIVLRGGGWLEELVGSAPIDRRELLARCIEMALIGTSRLPITSVETPHPAYTLGMIAYCDDVANSAIEQRARFLDWMLRLRQPQRIAALPVRPDEHLVLRALFNRLVLSPWTALVENLVLFLRRLDARQASDAIGYMLRHLVRHLNAFDLVKFHNRGANYPDALFLDALLRESIRRIGEYDTPQMRAALLHGWLARRRMENLAVPATPTSLGETTRFLPAWCESARPDDRSRKLFHDQPGEAMLTAAAKAALRRAAVEVDAIELGRATFLDRPLGLMKQPGDEDRTEMLSYESFSRRLAQRRVGEMVELGLLPAAIAVNAVTGFPVANMLGHARDGVVALEDAKKVALDFVFTRTTRSSLRTLMRQYDWSPLPNMSLERATLLVRTGRGVMTAFDDAQQPMFQLDYRDARYRELAGEELVEGMVAVVDGEAPIPIRPRV